MPKRTHWTGRTWSAYCTMPASPPRRSRPVRASCSPRRGGISSPRPAGSWPGAEADRRHNGGKRRPGSQIEHGEVTSFEVPSPPDGIASQLTLACLQMASHVWRSADVPTAVILSKDSAGGDRLGRRLPLPPDQPVDPRVRDLAVHDAVFPQRPFTHEPELLQHAG